MPEHEGQGRTAYYVERTELDAKYSTTPHDHTSDLLPAGRSNDVRGLGGKKIVVYGHGLAGIMQYSMPYSPNSIAANSGFISRRDASSVSFPFFTISTNRASTASRRSQYLGNICHLGRLVKHLFQQTTGVLARCFHHGHIPVENPSTVSQRFSQPRNRMARNAMW